MNNLNDVLWQKRSAVVVNRRKVIVLRDNAQSHIAKVVKDTLLPQECEVLPQPMYSPEQKLSDYPLLRSTQHDLAGTRFRNAEEVWKWFDDWIIGKSISFFWYSIALFPQRWEKYCRKWCKIFYLTDNVLRQLFSINAFFKWNNDQNACKYLLFLCNRSSTFLSCLNSAQFVNVEKKKANASLKNMYALQHCYAQCIMNAH